MSIDITEYTSSTKKAVLQFRKNLSDVLTADVTDSMLLKWIRAKNFNLQKSEEAYRFNLRFLAVFRIQELGQIWKMPEVIEKYGFANYLGIAKDGTPVRYIAMGRGDVRGFLQSLDVYALGKYFGHEVEQDLKRCREQSEKLGKEINEATYIMDMECYNLREFWFSGLLELSLDFLKVLQDHYPEIWKCILVVNAPFYFHYLFSFFKPILRFSFLEKLFVASKNESATLLLKHIDADVLPAFLGGRRVDSNGDPMCTEFMKFGGVIPENFYLCNRPPLLPTDPGVEDVWLPARSVHNILCVIREANTEMRVQCRSEGSISGTLLYRPFGPDPRELDLPGTNEYLDPREKKHNVVQCSPQLHLNTQMSPIDNFAHAPWPGIYIFRLDNSYNWFGKRVLHRIQAVPPGVKEV